MGPAEVGYEPSPNYGFCALPVCRVSLRRLALA